MRSEEGFAVEDLFDGPVGAGGLREFSTALDDEHALAVPLAPLAQPDDAPNACVSGAGQQLLRGG